MNYPTPPPLEPMYASADTSALRGASFGQAVARFWSKYATFTGRASRSEYWYATLFGVLVSLVLDVLQQANSGLWALTAIYSLAAFIPSLSIAVRRLHDIGKSGWWLLLYLAIIVGWIILIVWFATAEKPEGDKYNA